MKTRFRKCTAGLLLLCTLTYFLTGCDNSDYREAVRLYNNRSYDAAADIFYALGDYADSAELHTRSQYWAAVDLMEQGDYQRALPRFLKLTDYEDAADRVVECKYQLAIAAFDSGSGTTQNVCFWNTPITGRPGNICGKSHGSAFLMPWPHPARKAAAAIFSKRSRTA